jgi:hypothetical protein
LVRFSNIVIRSEYLVAGDNHLLAA